ncbi:MAG: helix-turn-helix transcriptional regulator [Acidobacteria bacterium]|nr:helix-turn-helix transcriptional regulator [Acidobacteriota bacterium]
MTPDQSDIDAMLPLQPGAFHILLALSAGDCHGYGIITDVEARTSGAIRLSPGTLYRTIQRLLEDELIEEPRKPSGHASDPRRRYYRITPFGVAVVRAETRRLADLVRLAKSALRAAPESA